MTRVTGDWLTRPATQRVMRLLTDAGHQAYAVGGCVRNALLGVAVADVDLSTDARPETVLALAKNAGLKAVPTGIDHGTVTVVSQGEGYEITTFRADVETDGRRAVVAFADDIRQDAVRRDFTMNALYAAADGTLVDPLGGLPDLQARIVRFIEDPTQRIREDYLRILRFFRFTAWYGDPEQGLDAEALAAIAANLDGLTGLSRERVGAEITKLLGAPDPAPAVAAMAQAGVLAVVLPGSDHKTLAPLVHLEARLGLQADAIRRLATTGFADGAGLRLSRAKQSRLTRLHDLVSDTAGLAEIAWRHGADTARDVLALRCAALGHEPGKADETAIADGAAARFPVTARDLMPGLQGAELGAALKEMERRWIASGFSLGRADLLTGRGDSGGDLG
ncbi:CCA tRNA nucleotidyltransferase [Thalassococcus sp. CAU 1522]|uniref:CCA tRNA nucleotidyltransferase n=1 Tax=Thalassococcus arenae TaxID=2851652 RepID=A0ABS6N779_9RHOB|nr:CCA tRNA nucleotidyltransferase [Thalassococcus arenae]MBV2359454.1 CCA tRNA nucleotidyltransferase [Thalassococcus arenae]